MTPRQQPPQKVRRRRASVRARAAMAAALAVAPALAAVSVTGVLFQRHQLTDGVALVAEEQARSVASAQQNQTGPQDALQGALGGEATLVQVVDSGGEVAEASPALVGRAPLVAADVEDPRRLGGLVEGEGDDYLVLSVSTDDGGRVVAAQSLESVDEATTSTVGLLVVGDPLLVLLVAGLSYLLAGRALRPVDGLRAQAADITAADLSARLPVPSTGDEVERLARTLNEMLARLDEAAQAQRRFVADASHELRSPIATIRTLHEVAEAMGAGADWPDASRGVLTETARLERLVGDLLLLARPATAPPTAPEPLDLVAVVRVEVARSRTVDVDLDLGPGTERGVLAMGRGDALGRSLRNLLDNAERHARHRIAVRVSAQGGVARVVVADDGAGIEVADRDRVFDRFVRLDEARARDDGGSGLGLAIARHLVEGHGGRVVVSDPTSLGGATLVIEVPTISGRGRG